MRFLALRIEVDGPLQWVDAIDGVLDRRVRAAPAWRSFPAHRMWTLFHLPQHADVQPGVLFVTANLNAGGAQRSLCNLALALHRSMRLEIAVCGDSSSDYFHDKLRRAEVAVNRSAATRDCFDHAEAIVQRAVSQGYATICFWNVDAKIKLLLVKTFAATAVRLIDVSPGGYAFEEMQAVRGFQQWIARRLLRAARVILFSKYRGDAPPAARGRVRIIPNGVTVPPRPALAPAHRGSW